MSNKPFDDDSDAWKNAPAKEPPQKKIPLDAAHECPMCGGKGFVRIVEEIKPSKKRPRIVEG